MALVFLSYRRTDAPAHAGRLYDRLVARFGEGQIFMDVDALEPGADFVEVIERTVDTCDALIAVIGPGWLDATDGQRRRLDDPADWVRIEIANALAGNLRVLPVLVQGAAMPSADELPEPLKPLARRHAVELTENLWGTQVTALIDSLERAFARSGVAAGQTTVGLVGSYKLGPENAVLTVQTGPPRGAAAKAGHDLTLEAHAWEATLRIGQDAAASSVKLTVDPTSLHVVKGVGGAQQLSDKDKSDIRSSIGKSVLKMMPIELRSDSVSVSPAQIAVSGHLAMGGTSKPLTFVIRVDGSSISSSVVIKQSDWGIKPYSALFGALKVNDNVTVELAGTLARS